MSSDSKIGIKSKNIDSVLNLYALLTSFSDLFFIFSTLWYFSIGLPDYKKLSNYQPPISSRVYSDDGKLIAEYAIQKRLFIPYESIPKIVINSFLSAEDKNFFTHPGVDAKGVLRAVIKNFSKKFLRYCLAPPKPRIFIMP